MAWSAAARRLESFAPGEIEDVAVIAIREVAEVVQAGKVDRFEQLTALTRVIADRRARDFIRSRQAERRDAGATETSEGREDLFSPLPGPLDQAAAHELAALLKGLADRLPKNQRRLLQSYYLQGLKQSEIAEQFGIPMGTVGVTLSRALEAVREELQKHPGLMKELKEAQR